MLLQHATVVVLPNSECIQMFVGVLNVYSVESKHRYSCSGLLTHESGWSFVGQTTRNSHITHHQVHIGLHIICLGRLLFFLKLWPQSAMWMWWGCHCDLHKSCTASVFLAWSCGCVLYLLIYHEPGDKKTTNNCNSPVIMFILFNVYVLCLW